MAQTRQTHYVQPVWLPHEYSLALLTNVTGSLDQLATYDIHSKQLRVITHGEEHIDHILPSPSGEALIYTASRDGHEKLQMYMYTFVTREHRALTANPLAMHRGVSWSPDSRYVVYSANSTHEKDFHIFELDTLTHNIAPIIVEDGCWDAMGYSPSGRYIVVRKRKGFHDHALYIWDKETHELYPVLIEADAQVECKNPFWSTDESVLYIMTNWNVDRMRIVALHLSSGYIQTVFEAEHEIDQFALSHDSSQAVVCENIAGKHRMHVLSRVENGWSAVHTKDIHGYARSVSWSSDDRYIAFSYHTPQSLPHILIVDTTLATFTQIPQQEEKVLEPNAPLPQEFSFTAFDGLSISGWYYLPQDVKAPFPVIVHFHGGPEDQHRYEYSAWIHRLTQSGYAVVAPNMRGSTGFGKNFMAADDKEKRFNAIADIKDLHAWITAQPQFDEKKCILSGGSYGAFLALAGLTWHPSLWQAGICRVGMYDLNHFFQHTAPWRKYLRGVEYGNPDADRELLSALSPLTHINRVRVPVLFVHGKNDVRISVQEVERAANALRALHVPVETLIFDNEGHSIEREENQRIMHQKSIAFIHQYLS